MSTDELVPLDEEHPCTGCGGPVLRGEVIEGTVIAWCDLCFYRLIVRWRREVFGQAATR